MDQIAWHLARYACSYAARNASCGTEGSSPAAVVVVTGRVVVVLSADDVGPPAVELDDAGAVVSGAVPEVVEEPGAVPATVPPVLAVWAGADAGAGAPE